MICRINESDAGLAPPKGFGYAYLDWVCGQRVYALFPFNWLLAFWDKYGQDILHPRFARNEYLRARKGKERIDAAYSKGWDQGEMHGYDKGYKAGRAAIQAQLQEAWDQIYGSRGF